MPVSDDMQQLRECCVPPDHDLTGIQPEGTTLKEMLVKYVMLFSFIAKLKMLVVVFLFCFLVFMNCLVARRFPEITLLFP